MNWYLLALKKCAVFSGRSRRKEYWFFVLFNFLVMIALAFLDASFGLYDLATGLGPLSGIYSLGVFIPSLAVLVRRLHDSDKTGWWFFIVFIPLIGWIVLLVFLLTDSTPGNNRYGADPKGPPE